MIIRSKIERIQNSQIPNFGWDWTRHGPIGPYVGNGQVREESNLRWKSAGQVVPSNLEGSEIAQTTQQSADSSLNADSGELQGG
jgi:hypothetical protein